MSDISKQLDDIELQLHQVQLATAQEGMQALLMQLGPDELRVWEPDIRRTGTHIF